MLQGPVNRVVFQEMGQMVGIGQVVDRHHLDLSEPTGGSLFQHGPEGQAPNPSKAVDSYTYSHRSPIFRKNCCRQTMCRSAPLPITRRPQSEKIPQHIGNLSERSSGQKSFERLRKANRGDHDQIMRIFFMAFKTPCLPDPSKEAPARRIFTEEALPRLAEFRSRFDNERQAGREPHPNRP